MKKFKMLMMAALTILSVSVFAQEKAGKKDTTSYTVYYTCPMHDEVKAKEAGKCPKCGMDLNMTKKEQMKAEVTKTYTCPVHVEITSNKPGKCSECSKKLILSKKEQMKAVIMKLYTCPMHSDVASDKPGKCSKCGMDLTKKNE